ncbi:MAG TPA: toll/interleukin-1 receptor domain-containing protein [Candidatus Margulisiibacteriota bacterium]|nr:toll/interleukin-1 receptor domain-containing protein [Candidatus Margulisiibacteriota bacterium]
MNAAEGRYSDPMRVFLSYSSAERPIAERIVLALRGAGHAVFFDRSELPPGESYDSRIQHAIESCEFFIFLISPESVSKGSYALTELGMAERKWDHPQGRVLPVMACPTALETVPAFLLAVTILDPKGDAAAEVTAAVDAAHQRRRRRLLRRVTAVIVTLGAVAGGGLAVLQGPRDSLVAPTPAAPVVNPSEQGRNEFLRARAQIAAGRMRDFVGTAQSEEASAALAESKYVPGEEWVQNRARQEAFQNKMAVHSRLVDQARTLLADAIRLRNEMLSRLPQTPSDRAQAPPYEFEQFWYPYQLSAVADDLEQLAKQLP